MTALVRGAGEFAIGQEPIPKPFRLDGGRNTIFGKSKDSKWDDACFTSCEPQPGPNPITPGVEATSDAIALAVAGQYIPSNIILSGALTVEQLRSNLLAHDLQLPSRSDVTPTAMEPATYWDQRSALAWT